MQGCTTYIQSLQGCVHLARDDRKVVCTLQMLMQGCHKLAATLQGCNNLAARLPQPRNFHMGSVSALEVGHDHVHYFVVWKLPYISICASRGLIVGMIVLITTTYLY